MFIKIGTVLSLLTISCGQPVEPNLNSKQAISSQSFVRQDVPLSYQYSAIHTYTTPEPRQTQTNGQYYQTGVNLNHQGIQYAPLSKPGERVQKLYTKVAEPIRQYKSRNEYTSEAVIKKDHLEPKPVVNNLENRVPFHLSYVPGQNTEVMQFSRNPGHNAVYRSYPENTGIEKNTKINYQREFTSYKKPENQLQIASENSSSNEKPYIVVPEQTHELYTNKYKVGYIPSLDKLTNENRQTESLQHPKMHRLILNLARAYNIAHSSLKAPMKIGVNLKSPAHTQAFIKKDSSLVEAPSNKITYLFAVPENMKHFPTHRLS
ncbi:uncharacterized protein LOC131847034 [Achroia grisella]|uniref:uncharacterized protein LOC131847034 n=1 Tax=Achroia grisella TaxID=688607 RepID=UPI0027D2BA44|nr:uncharacterized protein LOC131847034 [Achroia grisella]